MPSRGRACILIVLLGTMPSLSHAASLQPDSTKTPPTRVVRSAEWETLSTGLPEETRFRKIVGLRYNRVDGPA
ncbi:MAG TPA: hypothetical protein VE402_06825, partial [Candidatus Angelobacter sp.]|nr:hypothetical protein [Candidatus Angelobacter sp.]